MIQIFQFNTILGSMIAASSREGICMLEFSEIIDRDTVLQKYAATFEEYAEYSENNFIEWTIKELGEYFTGTRKSFTLKRALYGTDFNNQCGLERKKWLIDHESKLSGKGYSPQLI